jgi:hypothetical protein
MAAPQFVLPCLSARLELYTDCVVIHPTGSFARMFGMMDQSIPIKAIKAVRLFPSRPYRSGILVLRPWDETRKAIFVVYSDRHARAAAAVYETLDDLIARRNVASVVPKQE